MSHKAENILMSVLLLTLIVGSGYFLSYNFAASQFPYPLDYGEGPLLNQAKLLADGKNVYHASLTDYPYTITNYPPLFISLLAVLSRIFGLSYTIGRMISLVGSLLSALFIIILLYRFTNDRVVSILGGTLFLIHPVVVYWSPLARVDLLALAWSLAGILVAVEWPEARWTPYLSASLFVCAALTRQTYLFAGPLTVTVWLYLRSRRRAFAFLLTLVATCLVTSVFLYVLTEGGIVFHTIVANANRFSLSQVIYALVELTTTSVLLIAIGLAELLVAVRRKLRTITLPQLYLTSGFLAALAIGKLGANMNYLLELVAALCIITGTVVARWRQSTQNSKARLLLFTFLAMQILRLLWFAQLQTQQVELRVRMQPELRKLEQVVQSESGHVLADEYMGLLVMNGHQLLFQPFEFTQLAQEGKWDQSEVVNDIQKSRFDLILMSNQPPFRAQVVRSRWTSEMRDVIHEAYEPTEILAGTTLYRPSE